MSTAASLLVAAALLYLAVRVLESVLVPLLVVGGALVGGYGLFLGCRLVRRHRAGW